MNLFRSSVLLPFLILLTACDPDYLDTANQCAAGSTTAVRASYTDFSFNTAETTFKPYMTDIFTAMRLADGEVLEDDPNTVDNPLSAADKQAFIDEVIDLFAEEFGYTIVDNEITSVNNSIEFVEYLLANENPDEQIGLFEEAKRQVEEGINADDGYCFFENYNIRFDLLETNGDGELVRDTNGDFVREAEISVEPISMYYDPFDTVYKQTLRVIETVNPDDEDTIEQSSLDSAGFMDGQIYSPVGYVEPDIVKSFVKSTDNNETSIRVDDRYTNKLLKTFEDERDHIGFSFYGKRDIACDAETDDTNRIIAANDCEAGTTTRVIEKAACTVADDPNDDVVTLDLTNKIKTTSIDLGTNPRLQGIKRLFIETDYEAEETRIYVSKYWSAILDSDGVNVIEDPTQCEAEVVADELRQQLEAAGEDEAAIDAVPLPQYILDYYKYLVSIDANEPLNVISATVVQDPNYDIIQEIAYDENGIQEEDENGDPVLLSTSEPTPIITFKGVAIPARQTP